jgi:hypothetical protein
VYRFLKKIFPSRIALPVSENEMVKYDKPFFKDSNLSEELKKKGFAVRKLLGPEQIKQLTDDFSKIQTRSDHEIDQLFWNSGRSKSTAVRNMAKDTIQRNVVPNLKQFFHPDSADFMGGVFVVKPSTNMSELNPHQDSSHVEESCFISVYAWCCLSDVTVINGALHVIPGSHRFGNSQRSLNVPWQFEPFVQTLWKYAVPVEMKAGEVLFFDSAMIHCSPANKTDEMRLAVNFFIKQKEAPFLHYYCDIASSPLVVEKYMVDMHFYYDKDFETRPGPEYSKVGEESFKNLNLDERKVKRFCQLGAGIYQR